MTKGYARTVRSRHPAVTFMAMLHRDRQQSHTIDEMCLLRSLKRLKQSRELLAQTERQVGSVKHRTADTLRLR